MWYNSEQDTQDFPHVTDLQSRHSKYEMIGHFQFFGTDEYFRDH